MNAFKKTMLHRLFTVSVWVGGIDGVLETNGGLLERTRLRRGHATELPWTAGIMGAAFMGCAVELSGTPEIPKVPGECRRVPRPGGRKVVVGRSKDAKHGPPPGVYERTHKHFPNFVDCRPIHVREELETAAFKTQKALKKHMWVPAETVPGVKT